MKEKSKTDPRIEDSKERIRFLTLYNDDIHSFDYVIESLMDACMMDTIQAEQCTYITHYKGSCRVRKGSFSDLKQMKDRLTERELIARIE
ncbi:MAG: ATP-dependent Clp protease adaptor ClpS [Bacteroidales bacterium]|nr:MAG: ATP-dependent Clp protease adaptor ClpS [Bacteroidales bacterium]